MVILSSNTVAFDLPGARGTLGNIDTAINYAVRKAEIIFEQRFGNPLSEDLSLITGDKNPYLEVLKIDKDYNILIKFSINAKVVKDGEGRLSPVTPVLLGKDIMLLPIYELGDSKITAWECLTNADQGIQEFIGNYDKEFGASFLRRYTDNRYLSLCVYIKRDLVSAG